MWFIEKFFKIILGDTTCPPIFALPKQKGMR
jgi:hypothetical protein